MRNLRFALRTLFKTPFVTIVAIVSLALGIGANAAIFSLFDQILLRPLPVHDTASLVNLAAPGPKPGSQSCNEAGDCDVVVSYPMFRDLERQQTVLTGLVAHRIFGANLAYKGRTVNASGVFVSGSYFPVLELRPALGRLLSPGDDAAIGESRVVVLSYDYWRTSFDASPNVLNDTLIVNGQPLTIVGVAPRGFTGTTFGSRPNVFVPITLRGVLEPPFDGFKDRRTYWVYVFGRLKPGVTLTQASASLNGPYHAILNDVEAGLQKGMSQATLARFRAKQLALTPGARGQSSSPDHARVPLIMLFSLTGLVLLIACANIANLLLARSAARTQEMAIRLSIGASRMQLVRQLLLESCVLALIGGAAGLLVARLTLAGIGRLLPADTIAAIDYRIEPSVAIFAALLAIGTGVLFGLFPALHSTRPDLAGTLKGLSGQPGGGRSAAWFRMSLVGVQIALSTALLGSAGLFIKSLVNVTRIDLGFSIDHLVTFGVSPQLNGYKPEQSRLFFGRLESELRAQPGVVNVAEAIVPLLAGDNWGSGVSVEGFHAGPDTDNNSRYNEVNPGYFRTLGVPLIAGREFTPADAPAGAKVAIVNEAFAKKFGLGRSPVGKLMSDNTGENVKLDTEIVGFVQNAKYSDAKDDVPPLFFRPYVQDKDVGAMNFYVRTHLDAAQALSTVRRVAAQLDPNLPLEDVRTMEDQLRDNVFLDRMISTLSAAFAGLATLLAAIGLYGVLAYTVAQRTREFGLRMALGADPMRVARMVITWIGWLLLVGGAVGLAGAWGLGEFAASLLYKMNGHDVTVLASSLALLAVISLAAGLVPAIRAARIDPMRALRHE